MTLGDMIKNYRSEHRLSQDAIASRTGLSKAYISILERNINPSTGRPPEPTIKTIGLIADAIDSDFDSVISNLDPNIVISLQEQAPMAFLPAGQQEIPPGFSPPPDTYRVPRIGTIACGEPILAEENIEGYEEVPSNIHCDFTLRCKGDSMINARIFDGDLVYIRQQDEVESGEIAAVLIDGNEATLKRVRIFDDHIILEPENPTHKPLVFWEDEMNRVKIIGKATYFTSEII